MRNIGGATVIGPILLGVKKPIRLCASTSTGSDILNVAALAASELGQGRRGRNRACERRPQLWPGRPPAHGVEHL